MSPAFVTLPELAERLRVSPRFVRLRAARGEWPCHRLGALYRFSVEDVAAIEELLAVPASVVPAPAVARRRSSKAEKLARVRQVRDSRARARAVS